MIKAKSFQLKLKCCVEAIDYVVWLLVTFFSTGLRFDFLKAFGHCYLERLSDLGVLSFVNLQYCQVLFHTYVELICDEWWVSLYPEMTQNSLTCWIISYGSAFPHSVWSHGYFVSVIIFAIISLFQQDSGRINSCTQCSTRWVHHNSFNMYNF